MKRAYFYGMAGLAGAAVSVTAAAGLFSGEESNASEAVAHTAGVPAPLVNRIAAPPVVPVVPAAPVIPAAAPVVKIAPAKPSPAPVKHTAHKQVDRHVKRPAVIVKVASPQPAAQPPVVPPALAKPVKDTVTKALETASGAVDKAKGLVDQAAAEIQKAKTELDKTKAELGKTKPKCAKPTLPTSMPKHRKVAPAPIELKKAEPKQGDNKVSVSLDSSQVKPGQKRTITKTTADGSASASVTVSVG